MNLFKIKKEAAETDKEIREKRPKKTKEKNSVEIAHPDDVFVLEGPKNLGQAKNTVQIREEIMKAFHRRPGVFAYQGITASKIKEEFTKVAMQLVDAGLHKEAADLLKIADGEDAVIAPAPAASLNPKDILKNKAREKKTVAPSAGIAGAASFLDDLQQAKVEAPAATVKPKPIEQPIASEAPKFEQPVEVEAPKKSVLERAQERMRAQRAEREALKNTETKAPAQEVPATPSTKKPAVDMPGIDPEKIKLPTETPAKTLKDEIKSVYTEKKPAASTTDVDSSPTVSPAGKKPSGLSSAVSKGADTLANSSKLQKTLGLLGAAGSIWSVFSDGPNASNVTTAILSAAPMLVGGSIISAPVAAGAAATGLAGILLYKAFTGTVKETLDTDIDQAQEEIRDLLSDSDYSERSRKILNRLSNNLENVKRAYSTFQLGKGTDEQNIQAANVLVNANDLIQKDFEQFALIGKDESGLFESKFRGFFGGPTGFPSLSNAIKDIREDISQALAAFASDSAAVSEIVSSVAAENADSKETQDKINAVKKPTEKDLAKKEFDRIKGIQKYLIENGAEDVQMTGEFDSATWDGLQEISNKLSQVGITEGTVEKLSRTTYNDLYMIRDRLMKAKNR